MLKRFLYLLIIAFTFQVSWAMASAYCMHESGKAGQHFGHHEHHHQASSANADDGQGSSNKKAVFHPDCASCSHGSLADYSARVEFALPPLASYQQVTLPAPPPAPYLGQPERPQWRATD